LKYSTSQYITYNMWQIVETIVKDMRLLIGKAGNHSQVLVVWMVILSVSLLTSCTTLPHYGQPRFHTGVSLATLDTLSYRDLCVADFKSRKLPEDIRAYSHKLSAHTAVSLRTANDAKFIVTRMLLGNNTVFLGAIEDLAFEAVMIPERSWWSPNLKKSRYNYVLQHEQIHFALMQVAAQELNDRIKKSPESFIVFEESPEKARKKIQQLIDQLIAGSREKVLKEHIRFDEDTSGKYVPDIQQHWYDEVTGKLNF
jgi:hypothetical protein